MFLDRPGPCTYSTCDLPTSYIHWKQLAFTNRDRKQGTVGANGKQVRHTPVHANGVGGRVLTTGHEATVFQEPAEGAGGVTSVNKRDTDIRAKADSALDINDSFLLC